MFEQFSYMVTGYYFGMHTWPCSGVFFRSREVESRFSSLGEWRLEAASVLGWMDAMLRDGNVRGDSMDGFDCGLFDRSVIRLVQCESGGLGC